MKNKMLTIYAALAAMIVTVGAVFGFSPVEADAILKLCVDWTIGATGHVDGIAIAAVTLAGLREKRAKVVDAMKNLHEAAGDGVLTDEQQREWEAKETELRGIDTRIKQQEVLDEAQRQLDQPEEVRTVETTVEVREQQGIHWRKRVVRYFNALAMEGENRDLAMQMLASVKSEVRSLPTQQLRDEMDEAAQIVNRSAVHPARQAMLRELLGVGEFRTLTTGVDDALGGESLLPRPFLAEIFVLAEQYGVARNIFRTLPFTGAGNTMSLKNIVGKVIAYWVDQAELIPPSDLEFGDDTLEFRKLAGITSWTNEAQEDTMFNLIPIVQAEFAEAIAEKEDAAGLLGDGTATYGGFTGVLNLPGVTTVNTGGTNSTVTEANLRALRASVKQNHRRNARWVLHESIMDQIRILENTAGYRLFTEPLSEGGSERLLGYPVTFAEVMPAAGDVSGNDTPFVAFGDFSRVLMGIKRGMTADVSRHGALQNTSNGAIIYNAYQADGALLRVTERVGFATPQSVQGAIAVMKTQAGVG